jgi:hypothetical protein
MKTILMLAVLAASSAFGQDAASLFASHDYRGAAQQLEQELKTSPPSAEKYYDLGLANEKAGDSVQAALNYERALLLDPGLKSARNAMALLATSKNIPLPPHAWTDEVSAFVHPDTLAISGAVLIWIGAFGLLFATRAGNRRGGVTALAVLALIMGGASITTGWLSDVRMKSSHPAVVASKDGVEVLTAPANNSTAVVSLPPGTPVSVLSPRGTWTYIDVNGGARGWVQTERLTPVVPGEIF